ncbi:unnamed protein product [Sphagnum balticum]
MFVEIRARIVRDNGRHAYATLPTMSMSADDQPDYTVDEMLTEVCALLCDNQVGASKDGPYECVILQQSKTLHENNMYVQIQKYIILGDYTNAIAYLDSWLRAKNTKCDADMQQLRFAAHLAIVMRAFHVDSIEGYAGLRVLFWTDEDYQQDQHHTTAVLWLYMRDLISTGRQSDFVAYYARAIHERTFQIDAYAQYCAGVLDETARKYALIWVCKFTNNVGKRARLHAVHGAHITRSTAVSSRRRAVDWQRNTLIDAARREQYAALVTQNDAAILRYSESGRLVFTGIVFDASYLELRTYFQEMCTQLEKVLCFPSPGWMIAEGVDADAVSGIAFC